MQIKMVFDGKAELMEAFKAYDTAGRGIMKADELGVMLSQIPEKLSAIEVQRMVEEADMKKSGSIVFEGKSLRGKGEGDVCVECKFRFCGLSKEGRFFFMAFIPSGKRVSIR